MRSSFQFQLSCERVRMRAFRFFAVFSLLLIQQRTEGTYNGRLESTLELSDLITQDLLEKYSDVDAEDFWASNSLSFSSSPREVVHVDKIEKLVIPGEYLEWKYVRLGFYHYIIGMRRNSIHVLGPDLIEITSTRSSVPLLSLTVFARWNFVKGYPEVIISVATDEGITIYKLEHDSITKLNQGWPLLGRIKCLQYAHVGTSDKLIVVPSDPTQPLSIYNVAVNETGQFWYHERLPISEESYLTVYDVGTESHIAIATGTSIEIYGYDTDKSRYIKVQTILLSYPSKEIASFSIGYKLYLVSVPFKIEESLEFFGYNGHEFTKEDGIIDFKGSSQIHALNVEDYRDENFILSKGKEGKISVLTFDGRKFSNEYDCPPEICFSSANLAKGVGFTIEDRSYYILPSEESVQEADVLVISKSLEETLSPLYKQSADVISQLRDLFERYNRWEGAVTSAKETLEDSLSLAEASHTITGNWKIPTLQGSAIALQRETEKEDFEPNPFKSFTFANIPWKDADFFVTLQSADMKVMELKDSLEGAKAILKDAIPIDSDQVYMVYGAQNFDGSMQAPALIAETLHTPGINSIKSIDEFLESFILYEKSIQIDSSVQFVGELNVSGISTESINGIPVEHIARLSRDNDFSSHVEFNEVFTIEGNLLTKDINGVDFSKELIRYNSISDVVFLDGIVSLSEATLTAPLDSIHIKKDVFDKIFLSSPAQAISVPLIFEEIFVYGNNVQIESINGESLVDILNSIVLPDSPIVTGETLVVGEVTVESLFIQNNLNKLKFPEEYLTTSQKKAVISGPKTFSSLTAANVVVDGLVDGIRTTDLIGRMEGTSFESNWVFTGEVTFLDDLTVKGFVDGIKMDSLKHTDTLDEFKFSYYPDADIKFLQPVNFRNFRVQSAINHKGFNETFGEIIAFEGSEVTIQGETIFLHSIKALDLQLSANMINGVKLDEIFSLTSSQNIKGHLSFENEVQFSSLYALDKFDSVDLALLFEDAYQLSTGRTISSELYFDEIHCSKMKVDGPINGIHEFSSSVAVTSGRKEQVFTGYTEFGILEVAGNLVLDPPAEFKTTKTINGFDINSWNKRRISCSEDFETSAPVEIEGTVITRHPIDTLKINDVLLSYLAEEVLRTDKQSQTFTSQIEISSPVTVNGMVLFKDKLCGYYLERLIDEVIPLRGNDVVTVTGDWAFESLIINDDLTVGTKTCGVDLAKLYVDAVRMGESDIYISGYKIFLREIEAEEDLYLSTVNSEDLFSSVVTLNSPQDITGEIDFSGSVYVNEELVAESINGVSLSWLRSIYAFENGNTHVLKSDIECQGSLESLDLSVQKLVQGTDIRKFLLNTVSTTDQDLRIGGHKVFSGAVLIKGNLDVESLNGLNLEFLKLIPLTSANLQIPAPISFRGSVEAPGLHLFHGDITTDDLIGYLNLTEMIEQAIYLNGYGSLGSIWLESIRVSENIENVKTLNGIVVSDIIRLDHSRTLPKLVVKQAVVTGKNLEVEGLFSGVDVVQEYENTVFKNKHHLQVVSGLKTFTGMLHVKGNFDCLGELSKQVVPLKDSGEISCDLDFQKTIVVENNLELTGKMNGVYLDELFRDSLTDGRAETITGHWTFDGGVTFKDSVTGQSELDGFNIEALVDEKKAEAQVAEENFGVEKDYFYERCDLLEVLYRRVSQSPIKLEFFDTHQDPIILKQNINSLVHIRAGNLSRILTSSQACEVNSFDWNSETELFIPSYSFPLRLGHVLQWETISNDGLTILVYSTKNSGCSTQGIYSLTMDASGAYGTKQTLLKETFVGMELIRQNDGDIAVLILSSNGKTLISFVWDNSNLRFEQKTQVVLEEPSLSMKIFAVGNTLQILTSSQYSLHFQELIWQKSKGVIELGKRDIVPFNGNAFSNGKVQVLQVQQKTFLFIENSQSTIGSDCNLEVFELKTSGIELFQRLQSNSVVSMKTFLFGSEEYMTVLTKDSGIQIYRYMGMIGFQALSGCPLRISHGQGIITFSLPLWNYRLPRPFIAVSTGTALHILHSNVIGDRMEYKSDVMHDLCSLSGPH